MAVQNVVKEYVQANLSGRLGASNWVQPAYRAIAAEVDLDEGAFLDLGSHGGWVCIHVASGKPELDAIGIVEDEEAGHRADTHKERRLNVTFRVMDAATITYPEHTFQVVLAHAIVPEWPDIAAVLTEVHRVLTPGGRMLVYDPQPEAEIPDGWVERKGAWPPEGLIRRHLRKGAMSDDQWNTLKAAIKDSPFGGGQEGTHGFYRRLVLEKA